MTEETWQQITATPDVYNLYLEKLGVENITINEVYCFEEEFVGLTKGFLLVLPHPITNQNLFKDNTTTITRPIFTTQCIENICGLVGLCHNLLNRTDVIYKEDGLFASFKKQILEKQTADERGLVYFMFKELHLEMAKLNTNEQDKEREEGDENYHIIALIEHDDALFILDGRKGNFAVEKRVTEKSFTKQALEYIQSQIVELDKFAILSLN